MDTSDSSAVAHEEAREMETAPCISNRDDDDSSRVHDENCRLRAEVVELRERLRRFEQEERLSMHRTGHQWNRHHSWMDPHHSPTAHDQADSDMMSQSTLTEQDASLDTVHDRPHDTSLNGPSTFCKQPSVVSIQSQSTLKSKDVEEATTATTATQQSNIKIAHDAAFETNYKDESFWLMMGERAGWLVGLLLFQSVSSFVLEENQRLLQTYPVIVKFLTMLGKFVTKCLLDCRVRIFDT